MSAASGNDIPGDERLVAYLDDALPQDERAQIEAIIAGNDTVAARLAFLATAAPDLRGAFMPMLAAAPVARLEAMLDRTLAAHDALAASPASGATSGPTRRQMLAGAAALLVTGVLAGRLSVPDGLSGPEDDDGEAHWRQAVAGYMTLYTTQTLEGETGDPALQPVAAALGLPLPTDAVTIEGASLKQTQLLQYDGNPLAQILYLDAGTGPLALCIMRRRQEAAAPATEERLGLAIAYWSTQNHAFMLIGRRPSGALLAAATRLAGRLGATTG